MTNDSLVALIQTHLERYPEMDFMDVYKLLHQAAFGLGNTQVTRKAEREWLEEEYRIHKPDPKFRLMDVVSPDGKWVRLHLRPYMAAGGKIEPLLEAVVNSAQQVDLTLDRMAASWELFEQWVRDSERFPLREVILFGEVQAAQLWPAVPHSPAFVRAYRPLYRVLVADLAARLCQNQGIVAAN